MDAEDFETRLKAVIAEEISTAENYAQTELTPSRERALNYYNGDMDRDVPVLAGRSKYVSRDVSNVVGWTLPDLMRIFTASSRVLDCIPETEADEKVTDQAADYINYCFWRDNPGYQIMWDASWDALVNKDGVIKQYWDIKTDIKYSTYTGLDENEIAVLTSEDGVEIVEQSEPYDGITAVEVQVPKPQPQPAPMVDMQSPDLPSQAGQGVDSSSQGPQDQAAPPPAAPQMETQVQMQPIQLFDIKIKRTTKQGRLSYRAIAPENFLTDPNALDLIDNWRMQAEKEVDVTRSDLIKRGFARDRVDAIPAFSAQNTSSEDLARRHLVSGQYDSPEKAMEKVNLYEVYVKMDINDDGMAETVKVMYAGNSGGAEILDWEEWDDETPYDKIPCNPVPHQFSSDSLADEVMDVMKFKTIVGRQLFDNLYQVNMPTPDVEDGSILNMDAVVNPGIGIPIIRRKGSMPVGWKVTPFIGDKALMALQYLDDVIEMRTGVSRGSMALDPETLQNQSATAANIAQSASHSQVELIARNMAELGWKRVFGKSLKIIVKNQDRPRTIRLRDKWVDMDPRQWNTGMDVVVNVGLGTGSRDRDMAMLGQILTTQTADLQQLASAGFSDEAIDMVPKLIKTQVKIAEAAGIKAPETYYPDISPERLQEMKQQAQQRASQGDPAMQQQQAKLEADQQNQQAQLALQAQKQQSDHALAQWQAQQEIQMKQQQLNAEIQLRREQMAMETQLKQNAQWMGQRTGASISSDVHLGGQPG
jgi:hypothetical protein